MLRAHLRDGALAAAKSRSHAQAGPRHIAYAIARHLKERPEVAERLDEARRALGPAGTSFETPALTEEAKSLLASISSEEDAIAAFERVLAGGANGGGSGADESSEESAGETPEGEAVEAGPGTEAEEATETITAAADPEETVDDVLAELDALVGLEAVKEQVRGVIAVVRANQEREKAGHAPVNPSLHLVFTGPPGTGKTTVARLVARLYSACGALEGSKFTEVDRSSLVAGYVGQTAMKTSAAIQRTVPGVLFVDEAYALTPTHASDYGAEAIATLVKAMEDRRDELAVIFAGYSEEMAAFLESNPGLRSRLKTFIDFPDYTPAELVRIFAGFANSAGLHLHDETLEKAEGLFERALSRPAFGNGRFARSLFEQAYARMAVRAAEDGEVHIDELMELAPEDLEWSEIGVEVKRRRIGFDIGRPSQGGESPDADPGNEPPPAGEPTGPTPDDGAP